MVAEKSCNFGRYICVKVAMEHFEIIKCHGSGNDFILIDICKDERLKSVDWSSFARVACNRDSSIGSDGLLLVVRDEDGVYGMDMLTIFHRTKLLHKISPASRICLRQLKQAIRRTRPLP